MNKKLFLLAATILFFAEINFAQVGIGTATPNASSKLDITSTNSGLLIPRMTTAQRTAIALPATGLLVFDNDVNSFWFYDGTVWKSLSVQPSGAINFRFFANTSQAINASTNTKVNFATQSYLNNASFSNSIFTVSTSGLYSLNIALNIFGNNAGSLNLSLFVNNVFKSGGTYNIVNGIFQSIGFSDNVILSSGDLVTVQVNPNAAMAISVGQGTFFTGFKIN